MAHHHASRRIGVGDWTIASSQPFSRRLTELRRASETVHPALGALAGADVSKLNTKGYTNFLRTAAQVDREHGLGLAERGIVFGDEHTSGGANPPADHGNALAAAKPEPVGDQSPDPSRVGSVKDLVDRALLPGTGERKQYAALGTVSPEQAARLKADTGLDLAGYQGQEITASVIGYIDGYHDGEGAVRHCWADTLLRDDDGHYYAVRERYTRSSWEPNAEVTDETKKTRRISVRAAILWATTLTGDTQTLRQDAAVFFRQSKVSGARALAVLKPDAKTITVPVTLDLDLYEKTLAMGAYDNRTDFSATVAHCLYGDVEAWLDTDDKPSLAQFLKRWLKEHPHEQLSAASPQAVGLELVLDEQACSLVERFLAETPYEFTNRDVVSGCIRQSLDMAFRDKESESSLHHAPRDRTFADNGWGTWRKRCTTHASDGSDYPSSTAVRMTPSACRMTNKRTSAWACWFPLHRKTAGRLPAACATRTASRNPPRYGLNAAMPEPVTADEVAAARAAEPEKVRDGLLHLAADWRSEGARTGGASQTC